MQDKSFLGLLERCQSHTNLKSLQTDVEKIIQILQLSEKEAKERKNTEYGSIKAKPSSTWNIHYLDQSELYNRQILQFNVITPCYWDVMMKFQNFNVKLQINQVIQSLEMKLSKSEAYNKSELKHYQLSKQMVVCELINNNLFRDEETYQNYLNQLIQDLGDPFLGEGSLFLLLKIINQTNIKIITAKIKNNLQNLTPQTFVLLIQLQKYSHSNNLKFNWDKYIQERVFNRDKLTELLKKICDKFPRKTIFYKYLMVYMDQVKIQFKSNEDAEGIFSQFWNYLLELSDTIQSPQKHTYLILSLLKHFLKQIKFFQLLHVPSLIELWYRALGSSQQIIKSLAYKVEKSFAKCFNESNDFNYFVFLRSIYGYRFNPKSALPLSVFPKWTEKEVIQYFKIIKKKIHQAADPAEKLFHINEIFVMGELSFEQIKGKGFSKLLFYIYEEGTTEKIQLFYDSLSDDIKKEQEFSQVKDKIEDQCQTYYYSLIGKACKTNSDINYLKSLMFELCVQCKQMKELTDKIEAIEQKLQEINSLTENNHQDIQIQKVVNLGYCLGFFSLINIDEGLDILGEITHVIKDLLAKEQEPKPKKKIKKETQQPEKKHVVILVELFVQLLTKPPSFLRDAVNDCFKQFVSEIDQECLNILVDVLAKNDQEYIEEMEEANIVAEDEEESEVIGV